MTRTLTAAREEAARQHDELTLRILERAERRRARRSGRRWAKRAASLNARARRVDAEGRVNGRELLELIAAYGSRCAYCGHELDFTRTRQPCSDHDPHAATFDHVRPLGRGGRGDVGNLAPACADCNSRRSTWPDSALGVPAPHRFTLDA